MHLSYPSFQGPVDAALPPPPPRPKSQTTFSWSPRSVVPPLASIFSAGPDAAEPPPRSASLWPQDRRGPTPAAPAPLAGTNLTRSSPPPDPAPEEAPAAPAGPGARTIGIPKDARAGEKRVALVPSDVARLAAEGCRVLVERGAGAGSRFRDREYTAAGATLVDRAAAFAADVVALVQAPQASAWGWHDADLLQPRTCVVALGAGDALLPDRLATAGVSYVALDRLPAGFMAEGAALGAGAGPEGTLAAAMDGIAGARAVREAVTHYSLQHRGKFPATAVVLGGAGVGLQATTVALGLGIKVSVFEPDAAAAARARGIGARVLPFEPRAPPHASPPTALERSLRDADVVIAALPGPGGPWVARATVQQMRSGAVVVDVCGNVETTRPEVTYQHKHVTCVGYTDLAGREGRGASAVYSQWMLQVVLRVLHADGRLEDPALRAAAVVWDGELVADGAGDAAPGPGAAAGPDPPSGAGRESDAGAAFGARLRRTLAGCARRPCARGPDGARRRVVPLPGGAWPAPGTLACVGLGSLCVTSLFAAPGFVVVGVGAKAAAGVSAVGVVVWYCHAPDAEAGARALRRPLWTFVPVGFVCGVVGWVYVSYAGAVGFATAADAVAFHGPFALALWSLVRAVATHPGPVPEEWHSFDPSIVPLHVKRGGRELKSSGKACAPRPAPARPRAGPAVTCARPLNLSAFGAPPPRSRDMPDVKSFGSL